MKKRIARAALGAGAALLAGCSADVPAMIRRHTYPPNFRYIEHAEMDSAMWKLAYASSRLDRMMRQPDPIDAARRAEILALLDRMLAATKALNDGGRPSNHPLVSEHLGQFERDLAQARRGVEAEPPSYYLVGVVSGACLTCHSPQ